ncbi:hypothetical protein GCK72_006731 [Caenorhabditis remanei]|uniref:Serpentine receptor class gamma n=1 Tax=Caenorhabditis remanei TaxID=31234 RepID=A0A6A5HK54_CAERE|nr:hypothetical protein GCK72_006731 [Caenorhabditis remanei]KAF1766773.1 hypothetical protein GCK72_006731 [Caenorhabditis remanei]
MSCVLQPTSYKNTWKSLTPICYAILTIVPIGGIWNIAISKVYADPTRGGFTINYIKAVKWAALSMFQSIYILTALVITIICTSVTLYKLIVLPNRIKAAEKSLCFTMPTKMSQALAYLNLSDGIPEVYPIECDKSWDSYSEMLIYFGFFVFLGIGLAAHLYILISILFTKRKIFKDSSFFQIFAMDSIASVVIILDELFFIHLFLFVPPLCRTISPWFFRPTFIPKYVYISINHGRFMKSLAQIFMVLNRLSCVILTAPGKYEMLWKKYVLPSCIVMAVLPFAGTFNIFISRVLIVSMRGGFALGYGKTIKWASISLFQSSVLIIALSVTIICTSITLYKLILLPGRIKSAEKSLCFTSISISITFVIASSTQSLIAYCSTCNLDTLYIFQSIAFDTFTVGTAVIMLMSNKKLRGSMFQAVKRVSIVSVTGKMNSI